MHFCAKSQFFKGQFFFSGNFVRFSLVNFHNVFPWKNPFFHRFSKSKIPALADFCTYCKNTYSSTGGILQNMPRKKWIAAPCGGGKSRRLQVEKCTLVPPVEPFRCLLTASAWISRLRFASLEMTYLFCGKTSGRFRLRGNRKLFQPPAKTAPSRWGSPTKIRSLPQHLL